MSHLARIVDLKSALMDNEQINCPVKQNEIVDISFIRAAIGFAFIKGGVTKGVLCPDLEERVYDQLGCWNEVSPINGSWIMESVKQRLNQHHLQSTKGGEWCDFDSEMFEGWKEETRDAFNALRVKLIDELCKGEI